MLDFEEYNIKRKQINKLNLTPTETPKFTNLSNTFIICQILASAPSFCNRQNERSKCKTYEYYSKC